MFLKRLVLSFLFQTIRIDARFNSSYQYSSRTTAMQYFHILKTLAFLSCWTLICWFFFASEKNISDQVNAVMILIGLHLKTAFPKMRVIPKGILSQQKSGVQQGMVLKIDKSRRLNETSLVPLIQPLMPNVPLELWEENKKEQWFSKISCGR